MTDQSLPTKPSRRKWTLEALTAEASKYSSRSEFQKRDRGAYNTAYNRGVLSQVCQSLPSKHNKWTDEKLHDIALQYPTKIDFIQYNPLAYASAARKGIIEQICGHMTPMRNDEWDLGYLKSEALQYQFRSEFSKGSPKAYDLARVHGLLDLVCSHMGSRHSTWTDSLLAQEARGYQTRGSFIKNSSSAYTTARNRGIIDQICEHMEPAIHGSDTVYFWEAIGLQIFKFGLATESHGDHRIKEVARAVGVTPNIITKMKVTNPRHVECQLLKLGRPVDFPTKFDGYTEFRHLTGPEILDALRLLSKAAA